jgi:hypothetical protein
MVGDGRVPGRVAQHAIAPRLGGVSGGARKRDDGGRPLHARVVGRDAAGSQSEFPRARGRRWER